MAKLKGPEGVGWRCPRKACRKEISIRKDTFFSGNHLKMEVIIRLILLRATKFPIGKAVNELYFLVVPVGNCNNSYYCVIIIYTLS